VRLDRGLGRSWVIGFYVFLIGSVAILVVLACVLGRFLADTGYPKR
jgi:hypothetical protein